MVICSNVLRRDGYGYFFRNGWGSSQVWEEDLDIDGCADSEVGKEDREHAGKIGEVVGLWDMVFWDIGGSS